MGAKVKVFCLKAVNEFELTRSINEFNEKFEVFATQIFQVTGGWSAFLYYRNGVNGNGK